jgi:recombination protein RecA
MNQQGKNKSLENTVATLNKRFGDGIIMRLGDATHLNVEPFPPARSRWTLPWA